MTLRDKVRSACLKAATGKPRQVHSVYGYFMISPVYDYTKGDFRHRPENLCGVTMLDGATLEKIPNVPIVSINEKLSDMIDIFMEAMMNAGENTADESTKESNGR